MLSTCHHRRRSAPHGLTLIEVVLVLALLVILGGISIPVLQGSFSRAALQGSGDLLRGAWAKARLAAMQSGETRVFQFEPGGSRFQIVAMDGLGTIAAGEEVELAAEPAEFVRLSQNRLPEGIVFSGGDIAPSPHLLATMPGVLEGPWSQPILFFPDGTATDASLLLANSDQVTIRVTLRGLTGISQVADAESEVAP